MKLRRYRRARFNPAIAVVFHKLRCTTRSPMKSSATVPVADCTQAFAKPAPPGRVINA
jgi:hypothetical protein